MKPIVGVFILVLAVVVPASAYVVEDLDLGADNENLELADKYSLSDMQTEVGHQESENAPNVEDSESGQPELTKFRPNFRPIHILRPIFRPKSRPENEESKRSQDANNGKSSCVSTCVSEVAKRVCVRRVRKVCVRRVNVVTCTKWSTKCSRSDIAQLSAPVRSVGDQPWKRASTDSEPVVTDDEVQQENIAIAAMIFDSQRIFRERYDEKVVKAEKYEFSTSDLDDSDPEGKKLVSVVITLADGSRFEVIQESEVADDGKSLTVLVAYDLTEGWKLAELKDIQFSRVIDYVRASDSSVSYEEAVDKMMALD